MSSKPDRNTRVLRFEQKQNKTADDVNEGCWRILGQICCKKKKKEIIKELNVDFDDDQLTCFCSGCEIKIK